MSCPKRGVLTRPKNLSQRSVPTGRVIKYPKKCPPPGPPGVSGNPPWAGGPSRPLLGAQTGTPPNGSPDGYPLPGSLQLHLLPASGQSTQGRDRRYVSWTRWIGMYTAVGCRIGIVHRAGIPTIAIRYAYDSPSSVGIPMIDPEDDHRYRRCHRVCCIVMPMTMQRCVIARSFPDRSAQ